MAAEAARKKSRTIATEVNGELADMFGRMSISDGARGVDMDMAARGRRRTRKRSKKVHKKKARKTRKH